MKKCKHCGHEGPKEDFYYQRRACLDCFREQARLRYEKQKDKHKEFTKKWREKNPHKLREYDAKRRALKVSQACDCCNREEIQKFYKNCPEGNEVDHIVPLSKNGPHCLKNFQYLTSDENRRKSDKLITR